MLDSIIKLQEDKVNKTLDLVKIKNEIFFKSPTGSGKTFMMANFMNKVIQDEKDVIFIVSSLSKGGLAKQNAEKFKEYKALTNLNVHLITTKVSSESSLHIPLNYNIYVLPLSLNKKDGKLDRGAFLNFLLNMHKNNKKIYWIKDESHIATNNLDELKNHFEKIINFSATPNLKRGQHPDVEMTEIEAESVNLIKSVVPNYDEDTEQNRENAIIKFKELKKQYLDSVGINPCLIIQISNKDKAEEQIASLKTLINKHELKWMLILDGKGETNDSFDKKGKSLPFEKWTDFAKENTSSIDIIIFKMVLTEGWDIPRACMLYQIRDTDSEQLTEQVIGRVRRNPCLHNYEELTEEQKQLVKYSYVYSVEPKKNKEKIEVKLVDNQDSKIQDCLKIQTTKIVSIGNQKTFNISTFLENKPNSLTGLDIFTYYKKCRKFTNEMNTLYKSYIKSENDWFKFLENLDDISTKIKDTMSNYEVIYDKDVSFPLVSYYVEEKHKLMIGDWLWQRTNKDEHFSFDSETETEWANTLLDLIKLNPTQSQSRIVKSVKIKEEEEEIEKYLIGKNFLPNSEIKYEYYLNGIKNSYPDFILKDYKDNIHIFESKSLNVSSEITIDKNEYIEKIDALKTAYQKISVIVPHYFYIPIKDNEDWTIYQYKNGVETIFYTKKDFIKFMKIY